MQELVTKADLKTVLNAQTLKVSILVGMSFGALLVALMAVIRTSA
ncbi:hypothetical protein SAMN05216452_2037 [Nitratireductor aquibiodomus]|uniref:Uncharacterized protein n=1 Tax=Nitratireductor aquibiodomus TaxID=204799 RepID=A0A1H4K9D1_9HYPH|nr:hypothetical protein SAMN05216452_2037 [Nitratireductor aquibiodomus]